MKCRWLSDEFSAVCTNGKCPACADFCPCVNYQGICKFAEAENEIDGYNVLVEGEDVLTETRVPIYFPSGFNDKQHYTHRTGVIRKFRMKKPEKAKSELYAVKMLDGEMVLCYLGIDGELIEKEPKFTTVEES